MHESYVLSVANGLETVTLTEKCADRVRVVQRSTEWRMLGITRKLKIRSEEISKRQAIMDITRYLARQNDDTCT